MSDRREYMLHFNCFFRITGTEAMASKCVALAAVCERDLTRVKVMAKGLGATFWTRTAHDTSGLRPRLLVIKQLSTSYI